MYLVWIWLLTHCNDNGVVTYGIRQIAEAVGITPSGVHRAVLNIKAKMPSEVKHEVKQLYSQIQILNWAKYQRKAEQEVSSNRNGSETEAKHNKEIKNKEKEILSVKTQRVYDLFIEKFNKKKNLYKLTDARKKKIKCRLKDSGLELLETAITRVSTSLFHRGDNDRGWEADLDWIIKSQEQVEKCANLTIKIKQSEQVRVPDYAKGWK